MSNLLHFSDSHGRVPTVPDDVEYSIVVCSGDLGPDRYYRKEERLRLNLPSGGMPASKDYQEHWYRQSIPKFHALTRGKPFLFTPGNHDFYDPVPLLREAGIDAHNIVGRVAEFMGIRFYGFPYVPWCGGDWNHELRPPQMNFEVAEVRRLLEADAFDVLVAHCPPYKVMDKAKNGMECGIAGMTKLLVELPEEKLPKAYLCGHVHAAAGAGRFRGTFVSNAATQTRVIPMWVSD